MCVGLLRVWLTEGIPFCFVDRPIVYRRVREHIARGLEIETNDVSMTGSARLGFSLSPYKFLAAFTPGVSDLDLFCVSEAVFARLLAEYDQGLAAWKTGAIKVSEKGRQDILDNIAHSRRIQGGTASSTATRYRSCHRDLSPNSPAAAMACVREVLAGLDQLPFLPKFKATANLRVYQSWDQAVDQISLSVQSALSKYGALI